VLNRVNQLVDRIHAQGPSASIDVDQAALRVTLDVIGLVRAHVSAFTWAAAVTVCVCVWGGGVTGGSCHAGLYSTPDEAS
jgi:hypothetical protein